MNIQRLHVVAIAVTLATAGALACTSMVDVVHSTHSGCSEGHNSAWTTYVGGVISHSDSRSCPVGLNVGGAATSAAKVYDTTAPNYGYGTAQTISVTTTPNAYTFYDYTCSGALAYPNESYFYWGSPRSGSSSLYDWQADPTVSWTVSTNPEYLCHGVFTSATTNPVLAVITVSYSMF